MAVSRKHILQQGPVISAMLRVAWEGGRGLGGAPPSTPGPEIRAVISPRKPSLVRDYIRDSGGDPAAWGSQLPPHLYPQWGFPLLMRTLVGLPYDLRRVLNAGCRIQRRAPLPADQPLHLRARLLSVDEGERRVILTQRLITGTAELPEALICDTQAILLRPRPAASGSPRREKPRIEKDLREVAQLRLGARAGLDFAILTGDFNPVHWLRPYARASGFSGTILHGFGSLAKAVESLNQSVRSGSVDWWDEIEVRFVRPLVLPASPRVYHAAGRFAVGDAIGGPAYLLGTYREAADG